MYLSVQHAARRLGVSRHTVRRWTTSGFLPCTRTAGGHRRIREEDVEELAHVIGGSNHLAAKLARQREVETLVETSVALVSRLEVSELLKEIAGRLTSLMDCHFCTISVYEPDEDTVYGPADYNAAGERLPDKDPYLLSHYPLTRRVIEAQELAVVNVGDPAADPAEVAELRRAGDRSLLMAPLVYGGSTVGLLELFDHVRERTYSRQELRLCRAISGQAAVALHNAQQFARARRSGESAGAVRADGGIGTESGAGDDGRPGRVVQAGDPTRRSDLLLTVTLPGQPFEGTIELVKLVAALTATSLIAHRPFR